MKKRKILVKHFKTLFKSKSKASEKEYENLKKKFSHLLPRKCSLKIYSFFHLDLKPKNLDVPSFTQKITKYKDILFRYI